MKSFEFRLTRVLDWRRRQAEIEEIKLTQLLAEAQRLADERRLLAERRTQSQHSVLSHRSPAPEELWRLRDYLDKAKRQDGVLAQQIAAQAVKVDAQRRRATEARQKREALERLRESRFDEWRREVDRETDSFASEAFLARWSRERL
jgi:flagellar export protein FliJ